MYPLAFLMTFLGLMGWTALASWKNLSRIFQLAFIMGFIAYLGILITSNVEPEIKMAIAFRDLIVIAIGAGLMISAKANKIVSLLLLFGAGMFIKLFYLPLLKSTFAETSAHTELFADGELLVELSPNYSIEDLRQLLSDYEVNINPAFSPSTEEITDLDDYYLIDVLTPEAELSKVEETLSGTMLLDWWEENEIIQIEPMMDKVVIPQRLPVKVNDPQAGSQWALNGLEISRVHSLLSRNEVIPQKKVLIAILDTGIDTDHEDLQDNFRSIDPNSDRDVNGHGTHIAGIIGATTNNQLGIASMPIDARYLQFTSVKVLSNQGFGNQAGIIKGMITAADAGADVISMSLGGPSKQKKQEAYRQAVAYCQEKGAIVVVAAGNAGTNAKGYAPANTPGVITVSAVDERLRQTSFSNHVHQIEMALAAPGDNILSTFPKNQYRTLRGTSMAAPHVSSVVGLILSLQPGLSTKEIFELLHRTGIDSNAPKRTGKIIQPAAALDAVLSSS